VYSRNRTEPRTDPCGTPHTISIGGDAEESGSNVLAPADRRQYVRTYGSSTFGTIAAPVSVNFLSRENVQNVFRHRSRTLVMLFVKFGTALLIGPAENCPISSPGRPLIQNLFWASDEGFKIASCITSQTRYLHAIQIWRVIRWQLFLFKHLWTILVEALLRDTCNACRAPCIC